MNKKVLKVVICVLCVCSIIVISLFKSNVMDKIGKQKIHGLVRVPETETIHDASEWMLALETSEWMGALETFGALSVDYQEEYLREDVPEISLHFKNDKNDVNISAHIILSEADKVSMYIAAHYDYEEKELLYKPVYIVQGEPGNTEKYEDEKNIDEYLNRYGLTRKDVQEYQEYMIYDVVVKTWTKAHWESYWLERWKLKRREEMIK